MFKDKKTGYNTSISTTDEEEAQIEAGIITGFNIMTVIGPKQIPIAEFSEPVRIPLYDREEEKFLGWSLYWVRNFKIPAGSFNGLKIFSKEEITEMNRARQA